MNTENQKILAAVALKILRPLARIMLRNGVACGSFEELVRKAYVDECFSEAKVQGQKATVSSVSAQTGLSRKEVKRLAELKHADQSGDSKRYNRAIRVISGWLNDRRFSSTENVALPLSIEDGDRSFAQLVKDYSGDIPTVAMLKALESAGCIETRNGNIHLIKHAYVPGNDSTEILNILGTDTNELINTIDHNLTCGSGDRYFQRKVSNYNLKLEAIPEFRKYLRTHSQALLENLDGWLSQNESKNGESDSRYVSLAVFYHEQDPNREDLS